MSDARLWLAGLVALPALVIGASFLRLDVERLRRLAVASAAAMLLAALVIAVSPRLRALSIRTSALSWVPGGEAIIRIDTLSAVLLPFAAGLWLLTVAVTPRAALDRGGLRRTALATLITLASFLTESAVVLLLLSVASVWTFLSALADPAHQYQRRIVAAYLGFSTLLFGVGVALLDRSWRAEHDDRNGGHVVDRDRGAGAERDRAVPRVGAGGVRSRTSGAGHSVQRTAGGRVHDRGADRAARLARHAADDRHPGARDRRVRGGARARPDQRAPGVRVPVHESVGAGDGGPRLHERERAGGRVAGVVVGRVGVCRTRPLRPRPRSAPRAARSDHVPRRVRAHAAAGDQLPRPWGWRAPASRARSASWARSSWWMAPSTRSR